VSYRTARFGDICEINPKMPKSIDDRATASFLPMAAVSEEGRISFEEERPVAAVKKGYTYFERGDVLVAKITPCFENGKASRTSSLSKPFGFGSTEFHVLRAANDILPDFLFYKIWSSSFRELGAQNMTGSAGQKRVPVDFLKRLEIRLPSFDEQRRIATILDKADSLRSRRRHALNLFEELMQSAFLEMFGTSQKETAVSKAISLQEFADIQVGFAFKSADYTEVHDSVRLCRGANVLPNRIDWSDLAKWPNERMDEFLDFQLQEGDIVIAMDRPWISSGFKVARVSAKDLPALLVQRVARVRPKSRDDGEFLFALIRSPAFTSHFRPTETTVPHISPTEIRSFVLHPPKVSERRSFADFTRRIRHSTSFAMAAYKNSDTLFSSLQSRAFSGQL
jgi:type I restriction enzyme, S subunit